MRILIPCISFFLFSFSCLHAQTPVFENWISGTSAFVYPLQTINASGGGHFVLMNQSVIVRLANDGHIVWAKKLTGSASQSDYRTIAKSSGTDLFFAGSAGLDFSDPDHSELTRITRTDSSMNIIWSLHLDSIPGTRDISILVKPNDDLILFVNTQDAPVYHTHAYGISSAGQLLWHEEYIAGTTITIFRDACMIDTNSIATLATYDLTSIPCLYAADHSGQLLWSASLPVLAWGNSWRSVAARTGGLAVSDSKQTILFLAANGQFMHALEYSFGTDSVQFEKIIKDPQGGLIVSGKYNNSWPFMMKTDSVGNPVWQYYYPSFHTLMAKPLADSSGYFLYCRWDSVPSQYNNFHYLRTDPSGRIYCNEISPVVITDPVLFTVGNQVVNTSSGLPGTIADTISETAMTFFMGQECFVLGTTETGLLPEDFSVYPNPASGFYFIRGFSNGELIRIRMYDLQGNLVLERLQTGTEAIDLTGFSSGLYFVQIEGGGRRMTKKMLLED